MATYMSFVVRGRSILALSVQKNKSSLRCILVLEEDLLLKESVWWYYIVELFSSIVQILWKRLDTATGTGFFSSNTPVL